MTHESNAPNILVPILATEAQPFGQVSSHNITVKHLNSVAPRT
jgi:hypothetical protein